MYLGPRKWLVHEVNIEKRLIDVVSHNEKIYFENQKLEFFIWIFLFQVTLR